MSFNFNRNYWVKWYQEWADWSGPDIKDWKRWKFPTPFLLDNVCVADCSSLLYSINYNNYTWNKNSYYNSAIVNSNPTCQTNSLYSRDNLSVQILLSGVNSNIMKISGGILSMEIANSRGSITVNKYEQIEPTPDPNVVLTNVLPLISGTTNQYLNNTTIVELNAQTIENYVEGTVFKVKASVQNSWGDLAEDYITFLKSSSPNIGDAVVSCIATPWKVQESMTITLTGDWYNTQVNFMELWIKIDLKLSDGSIIPLAVDKWEWKLFTFTLPIISRTSNSAISASIHITATNPFERSAVLTKAVTIDNTLSQSNTATVFTNKLDYANIDNIIILSSQIKWVLKTPTNYLYSQNSCIEEVDWSGQGTCKLERNGYTWNWYEGYSGVDWSIDSHQYSVLMEIVNKSVDTLIKNLTSNGLKTRANFEDYLILLSNLWIRPEFINYGYINLITQILESISNLNDDPLLSWSDTFDSSFIDLVSLYYVRIQYELNIQLKIGNATSYSSSVSSKGYADKLAKIQKNSQIVWIACEKFLSRISIKTTSSSTSILYNTVSGKFKIEYKIANTLIGTDYIIDSSKGYKAQLPSNLFDGMSFFSIK